MIRSAVIQQNLFAWRDVAQSEEQDVAVDDLAVTVRLARVIDELRAVPLTVTVNRPVGVDIGNVDASSVLHPPRDFPPRNLFARVFSDLAAFFETGGGETAVAVNLRRPDLDSRSSVNFTLQLKPRIKNSG